MSTRKDYFDKIVKLLKELKADNQDVELTKHLALATSEHDSLFDLSDKELYTALRKHKNEMEMNTLTIKDLEMIISDDVFDDLSDTEEEDF